MEGHQTSFIVGRVLRILGKGQLWPPVTTTVPEEYADKDEKETGACPNDDPSDGSSVQPSKIQFSYRFHAIQRLYPYEDEDPPPELQQ